MGFALCRSLVSEVARARSAGGCDGWGCGARLLCAAEGGRAGSLLKTLLTVLAVSVSVSV